RLLAAEVVVDGALVGRGRRRDPVDPGSGDAVLGELPSGGFEDAGLGGRGVVSHGRSLHIRTGWFVRARGRCMVVRRRTNQLVRSFSAPRSEAWSSTEPPKAGPAPARRSSPGRWSPCSHWPA